jgi:D-alanyl-D-alanine carboxypeptidase (penicillin-binding protein 5/6)
MNPEEQNRDRRETRDRRQARERRKKARRRRVILKGVVFAALLAVLIILISAQLMNRDAENSSNGAGSAPETESVSREENPEGSTSPTPELTPAATEIPTPTASPTPEPQVISGDSLYSSNALMIRLSDGAVLLDKGSHERIYPASMTKIMTAIVAIEHLPDLEEQITITSEQIDPLYEQGASLAGFDPGETVTVRDLLYGVLLPSGAEACVAVADRVAGSEQAFVELMNQKAQELSLTDTHFVTDSGLHDDDHYSTCADMAAILRYALQNETFRQIITAHDYTCTPTEQHPDGLYMESTLFQNLATDTLDNGGVIEGGKTGFTDEAQLCLASLASVNGQEYILVTAHAEGDHYTEPYHVLDAVNAYSQISG